MSEKGILTLLKYKHLIVAIIIVIIVIILDIIFENYSSKAIEKVSGKLEKIEDILKEDRGDFDEESIEDLESLSKKAKEEWEEKSGVLTCFIEHEEVEKINVKLHLLEIELNNSLWGDARRTLSETKQIVEYLNAKYSLSLQNIFWN